MKPAPIGFEPRTPESWYQSFSHEHGALFAGMLDADRPSSAAQVERSVGVGNRSTSRTDGMRPVAAVAPPSGMETKGNSYPRQANGVAGSDPTNETVAGRGAALTIASSMRLFTPVQPGSSSRTASPDRQLSQSTTPPQSRPAPPADLMLVVADRQGKIVVSVRAAGLSSDRLDSLHRGFALEASARNFILTHLLVNGIVLPVQKAGGGENRDG